MSASFRPPPGVDLLVVAAYAPELTGLRRLLGDDLHGEVSGVRVAGKTVGIGLANAAAGITLRVLRLRPRAVVLVGTCGCYEGSELHVNDAVVVRRAWLVDASEIEQKSAMPDPIGRSLECAPVLSLGLGNGKPPAHDVANTLGVVVDDLVAQQIASTTGCAIENLEAFGVANACALQGVPFAAVLGVSNRVGSSGREEWRAHHKTAALAACEVVARWLVAGVAGLPHTRVEDK